MEIYVVKPYDTVDEIALTYGIPVSNLIYDNQLVYPYRLAVGQALLINSGQGQRYKEIVSNGYAYPFISKWVLDNTLPYLSELSVFSYGFTEDGEPVLTLTPFGKDGKFNNNLISAIVRNKIYIV